MVYQSSEYGYGFSRLVPGVEPNAKASRQLLFDFSEPLNLKSCEWKWSLAPGAPPLSEDW